MDLAVVFYILFFSGYVVSMLVSGYFSRRLWLDDRLEVWSWNKMDKDIKKLASETGTPAEARRFAKNYLTCKKCMYLFTFMALGLFIVQIIIKNR